MTESNTHKKKPQLSEEELQAIKKRNKSILQKVKQWQTFPYVRPLVCPNEACNCCKLKPKMTKFKVILQCPKCKRVQPYVPKTVLKTRLDIPDILLRNKARHGAAKLEGLMDESED